MSFTTRRRGESLQLWIERNLSVPTATGCREWMRARHPRGYGLVSKGGPRAQSSRVYRVHRVYWELVNGPIPDGLHVCHHCDNRACCEPSHLFLGTNKQNMRDCDEKGRRPKGSGHWHSKLTEADVHDIRRLFAGGVTQREIAARYGINGATVSNVCTRTTWKHVA